MDRRTFFKSLLSTALVSPLLASPKPSPLRRDLFLIEDSPHKFIIPILEEIKELGLMNGKSFAFLTSPAQAEELERILNKNHWSYVSKNSQADIYFSFSLLKHPAPSSFTLIKDGQIADIRTQNLFLLWQEMNQKKNFSSFLTIASYKKPLPNSQSGSSASIHIDGKKIDRISLKKNFLKSYSTKNGRLTVVAESGKAWIQASTCPQKVCVSSAPISLPGERIICVPNRFLLEVEGPRFLDTIIG